MKTVATAVCIILAFCLGGVLSEDGGSSTENVQDWMYPDELLQRARALLEAQGRGNGARLYTVPQESGPLAFLKRGGRFLV